MSSSISYGISLLTGYAVGSLPFGLWLSLLWYKRDLRNFGSGNMGASNAWRLGGPKMFWIIFLCDSLKGALPVFFAPSNSQSWIGLGCLIGHLFPWILSFKGGKGVAIACGIQGVLRPIETLICFLLWMIIKRLTGYASLASFGALISHCIMVLGKTWFLQRSFFSDISLFPYALTLILIFFSHRENLSRFLNGKELKTSFKE